MPNIMVIDDEEMIRAGIVSIIRRLAPQWTVSECKDAQSAMRNIPLDKPDLMLIDISMPGMDGLELAHFLKEHHPAILKIVLTGHDKFAYVQNAMRADVVDYLLKPIIREELVEALEKAERLFNERAQVQQEVELARTKRLEQALLELLSGDLHSEEQLKQLLLDNGWSLNEVEYSFLMLIRDEDGFPQYDEIVPKLRESFLANFEEVENSYAFFADSRHFFVLSSGRNLGIDVIRQWWLEAWAAESGELGHNNTGNQHIAAAGASFASLGNLPEVFGDTIHEIYSSETGQKKLDSIYGDKERNDQQNQIRIALETNDSESLSDYLDGELKVIKQQAQDHHSILQLRLIHFLLIMLLPVLNQTESKLSLSLREIVANALSRLALPGSTIHLLTILSELEGRIRIMSLNLTGTVEKNKVIEIVKDYIHKYYGDKSLKLEALSKIVHLNPNYLSDLFKEVTGENYLVFLTSVRMNHAKKLLRETHLKNYEISDKTGYSSAKYFCKLFRQHYGMTPSEYRNRAELTIELEAE
ncbi:response regulator transcription factor [Cohnella abietis]|uniref:DNA-binding response regulator n=1 Tax=Cohnella abietis TaxID=2507935 RepID=A0A3T1DD20_9BACL|nr:response regulator [Cohnella abietis]BBI35989.1 hypothetical protein KCTCHS21_53880 [Cohnella abietis]